MLFLEGKQIILVLGHTNRINLYNYCFDFPSVELLFAQKIISLANRLATFELIPLGEVSEKVTKGFVYILGHGY